MPYSGTSVDVSTPANPAGSPIPYARLLGTGAIAATVAAVTTVAVAAVAQAADVSLEISGKVLPLSAFAFWVIVATAVGVVLAATLRRRQRFIWTTATMTALSLLPPIFAADDVATAVVLVATHLLAAVIVIPALSRCTIANERAYSPGNGH